MANKWGKMETVTDFILLDSKITVDGDCNHEINKNKNKTKKNNKKKNLLFAQKAMTNLDSILKAGTSLFQQISVWSKL